VGCRVELGGVVGGEWHETWAWPDDVAGTWNDSIGRRRPRRHRRQSARAYEAPDGYRPALMSTPPSEQERKQDSMGDEQSCMCILQIYRKRTRKRHHRPGRVPVRRLTARLGVVVAVGINSKLLDYCWSWAFASACWRFLFYRGSLGASLAVSGGCHWYPLKPSSDNSLVDFTADVLIAPNTWCAWCVADTCVGSHVR
jgi:hypothetical protein